MLARPHDASPQITLQVEARQTRIVHFVRPCHVFKVGRRPDIEECATSVGSPWLGIGIGRSQPAILAREKTRFCRAMRPPSRATSRETTRDCPKTSDLWFCLTVSIFPIVALVDCLKYTVANHSLYSGFPPPNPHEKRKLKILKRIEPVDTLFSTVFTCLDLVLRGLEA
jgi:hypothetical protein